MLKQVQHDICGNKCPQAPKQKNYSYFPLEMASSVPDIENKENCFLEHEIAPATLFEAVIAL